MIKFKHRWLLSALLTCLAIPPLCAQVSISPLIPSASPLTIVYGPSGWPTTTVLASITCLAEGPGSQFPAGVGGTANCDIHVYWPGSSLSGAPTSVTVPWYTTDVLGYQYYLRGSGYQPMSGNVHGTAAVTEQNGTALNYSETYQQQTTTIENDGSDLQAGESQSAGTYATNFQRDPEDGYYYCDITVDAVILSSSDSYIAPTYGDTKDNSFSTGAAVYFTIPS